MNALRLGPVGIWSAQLRFGDPVQALEAAAELDELGFGALWVPDIGGPVLETVRSLLGATSRAVIATGILNVWMHAAAEVAEGHAEIEREHPGRFLLGLGISHAPVVDADEPGRYRRPLTTMREYLDALDAAPAGPPRPRVLAALGPKMVALAGERTDGIHPYLVPVEHTALVREALGPNRIVAPALSVVLEADRHRALDIARADIGAMYLGLPNYTNNWLRLGFTEDDLAGGGSDRLLEALYALGSAEQIAERVRAHLDAGADHVCVRAITAHADDATRLPVEDWRELAPALLS